MTLPATAATAHKQNIASFAVDLAAALGIDTAFSLAGGMAMYLNRAVARHARLKPVYCQHEQACVAAAEGYAKAADFRRPGLAVVTAGPGVSNTVTSLLSAYGDSTPLIVLAGQIKEEDIDRYGTRSHGVQEIPSRALITPCVKRFVRLEREGYRAALIDAFAEALLGRPGPVFVEIPLDVQGWQIEDGEQALAEALAEIETRRQEECSAGVDLLVPVLDSLLEARRPLLYLGNGCRIAGVEQATIRFAHRHRIPVVFSWLSFDLMTADDPLHFGCPGGLAPLSSNRILGTADEIVFLGARLDLGTTAFQRVRFGSQARRRIVDVDPAELRKFAGMERTEGVAVNLRGFAAAARAVEDRESRAEEQWLSWCSALRDQALEEEKRRLSGTELNGYTMAERLSPWARGMVVVAASSGYAEETLTRFFRPGHRTRFFNGAALGSMGLGLPHALGASFSASGRVLCLEADGGIMLNCQELATLAHYAPPGFVLFLLNNHGYESIRSSQTRHGDPLSGVDEASGVFLPSFAKLCRAFALDYCQVRSLAEFEQVLGDLEARTAPMVVDVHLPNFEPRGPGVRTVFSAEGRPSSTPLEEIDW